MESLDGNLSLVIKINTNNVTKMITSYYITSIHDEFFRSCSRIRGWGEDKKALPPP